MQLLVFALDDWKCALRLSAVEKAYRAAAVTPLPEAPDIVLGIIDVRGEVMPVVDLRKCFRLPPKDLAPDDQLIVGHTARRSVALVVDRVLEVIECGEQGISATDTILPGMDCVEGVARLSDGMILIYDLDRFLSLEQEAALDDAMGGM